MHTWSSRCLQTPWMLRACCSRSSRFCGSFISKSSARGCGNGPRAHQTHARLSRADNFSPKRCVRRRRSSVGTLVLGANTKERSSQQPSTKRQHRRVRRTTSTSLRRWSFTRGGSSCYGARERSTSQRAGAPFSYAEGLAGLPKLLRLSY